MSSQSDEMAVYDAIYCTECGGRTMIVVTPPLSVVVECVRKEEQRYHARDKCRGPGTYRDVHVRLLALGFDVTLDEVVELLRQAEALGMIEGKGFYCGAGRGGAKRWRTTGITQEVLE